MSTAIQVEMPARSEAPATNAMPKVVAKSVNVYYGEKHALKDVSIDIPERSVTAFIGRRAAASRPSCAASTG